MDGDDEEVLGTKPLLDFPVVGIGASAGGLEAVTEMFREIDRGTGMAFVLVMHLDPDHESLMVELLGRKMHIEVRQIADGDDIEVDCLHVIPPGSSLSLEDGKFRLESFSEPRGLRRPIDSFFISLAHMQGHKAACVILSGTGADGTAGMRIVKEYGGICAVQSPEEARYDGMPFSAISTKLVDFTLFANSVVPRIRSFFDGADLNRFPSEEESEEFMQEITRIIHKQLGHDFSGYKRSTLLRRLFRRLQVLEYSNPEDYIKFLKTDASEQQALAQDFLINVTSFFRDREHFEIMRKKVIVPLIQNAEASDEVRVWVPGCSSGQEAYSIAMMIDETCEELKNRPLVQIFATDIDATMITQARKGQYTVSSFNELPKKYQDRYTSGLDGKFEIIKKIREMVRFSVHSIIQDPPFSKIDLISCRNLLIYLGEDLQKELFPLMHFSLKPGGTLFLGNSENVTRRGELFSTIDQRARLFRRQNLDKRLQIHLPLGSRNRGITTTKSPNRLTKELDFPRHRSLDASNLTIYEQYAPPFVRVSHDGRILDSSGDLSLFLMSRPGEERDLGSLARSEVRNLVLPLVSDALHEDRRRALKDVEVSSPFGIINADIIAHPMKDETVAVIFLVKDRLKPVIDEYEHFPVTQDRRISDLQEELQANRLLLKSKIEEIETANEELKSSNEEMMSMNEELQSANEELTTANEELKNKIDELTLANADLDNFLKSADLAMVVLDRSLRIRHVTSAARRIMPIKHSDQGRSLGEFNVAFGSLDLLDEIRRVIVSGEPAEHTTDMDEEGRAFFVRITPYFFAESTVEGASVTVVDISSEVELRHNLFVESERVKLALKAGGIGFAEIDVEREDVTIDAELARKFELGGADVVPMADIEAAIVEEDRTAFRNGFDQAIESGEEYDLDFRIRPNSGSEMWIRSRGIPRVSVDGRKQVIAAMLDVTATKSALTLQETLVSELSHRIKNLFSVISALVQSAPKSSDAVTSFADELVGRIVALGRAYDLVKQKNMADGVELVDLLRSTLKPHFSEQKFILDGPAIEVDESCITTFTLVLHELATNAVKHGALSQPDGQIRIAWERGEDQRVAIKWKESWPGFTNDVDASGFGTRLVEMGMIQLHGDFNRTYDPDGANIEMAVKIEPERGHK